MQIKSVGMTVLVLLTAALLPAVVRAGAPTEQLRQTVDKVLMIVRDPQLKAGEKQNERRDQLRQVISARFDFAEMAKRSLGPHWQRQNADEQGQFVSLFTGVLERSYADQIEAYDGEEISYGRETGDQDHAEVETKLVTNKGQNFSINYKLRVVNGDWKVYDVIIENISLVNNFRAQFNRVLASASFAELLKKLQSKSPEIRAARS